MQDIESSLNDTGAAKLKGQAGKGDDPRPVNPRTWNRNFGSIKFPLSNPEGLERTGINRARKVYK